MTAQATAKPGAEYGWLWKVALPAAAAGAAVGAAVALALSGKGKQVLPSARRVGKWTDLIGNTPVIEIECLSRATGCTILAKMESSNPGGSSKDRVAQRVLQDAAPDGRAAPARVFEGTSGSTGISLALIGRALGAATRVWLPDDTAASKVNLLHRVGAKVTQVPNVSIVSAQHYVNLARASAAADPSAVFADQFETPSNVAVHYDTTGPEIWAQTGSGNLDAFVCGAGTGGTIAGVSQYLKEVSGGKVHVALADPPGSSLYNWAAHGTAFAPQQAEVSVRRHRYDTVIEGVGLDRVTANLSLAVIDAAHKVSDQEALDMSRYLLQEEGLFVGSSSAMNAAAAVKVARSMPPGSVIMTLLCDHGSRHLSRFWNDEYCVGAGLVPPVVQEGGAEGGAEPGVRALPSGTVDFVQSD